MHNLPFYKIIYYNKRFPPQQLRNSTIIVYEQSKCLTNVETC